jgi:hypothetical protein
MTEDTVLAHAELETLQRHLEDARTRMLERLDVQRDIPDLGIRQATTKATFGGECDA